MLRNLHTSTSPGKASFSHVLMVGFQFVSQECPSISFFFARLRVFLEYSTGCRPQAGLFVLHSSAFKPVLLFLYPFIRQSLIKYHSEMARIEYRAEDVRSSEFETQDCLLVRSL